MMPMLTANVLRFSRSRRGPDVRRTMMEALSIDNQLDPPPRLNLDDREAIRTPSAETRTIEGVPISDGSGGGDHSCPRSVRRISRLGCPISRHTRGLLSYRSLSGPSTGGSVPSWCGHGRRRARSRRHSGHHPHRSQLVVFVPCSRGLLTETGGLMTHVALIIREYSLLAVVGLAHTIRLIWDGQWIHTHGTDGHIKILPQPGSARHEVSVF